MPALCPRYNFPKRLEFGHVWGRLGKIFGVWGKFWGGVVGGFWKVSEVSLRYFERLLGKSVGDYSRKKQIRNSRNVLNPIKHIEILHPDREFQETLNIYIYIYIYCFVITRHREGCFRSSLDELLLQASRSFPNPPGTSKTSGKHYNN